MRGLGYVFGRVIRDDCALSPPYAPRPWKRETWVYLVYFYKGVSQTPDVVPSLSADNLLFAPCKTSQYGWNKGFFRPVAILPILAGEVLPKHCFTVPKDYFVVDERRGPIYFTEYGEPLTGPLEYCIEDSLYGCYEIEGQIARAFGLPIRDTTDEWRETGTRSVTERVKNGNQTPSRTEEKQTTATEPRPAKAPKQKQKSTRKPGKK
jgi:hypothetical protein